MRGWLRGHEVEWDETDAIWRHVDTHAPASGPVADPRECPQCGYPPSAEGHDHCLMNLPGVSSACCGHGRHIGYITYPGIPAPAGWAFGAYVGVEQ